MTDNTANDKKYPEPPIEIWANIARFLDTPDLANFRQVCRLTQLIASDRFILQPLYHRFYTLDNTLPPLLPPENALIAFKQAVEKIQARQQSEITYLTQHHPALMAKPE